MSVPFSTIVLSVDRRSRHRRGYNFFASILHLVLAPLFCRASSARTLIKRAVLDIHLAPARPSRQFLPASVRAVARSCVRIRSRCSVLRLSTCFVCLICFCDRFNLLCFFFLVSCFQVPVFCFRVIVRCPGPLKRSIRRILHGLPRRLLARSVLGCGCRMRDAWCQISPSSRIVLPVIINAIHSLCLLLSTVWAEV